MQGKRKHYKKRNRERVTLIALFAVAAIALVAFNRNRTTDISAAGGLKATVSDSPEAALALLTQCDTDNPWAQALDTMPGDGCVKMKINGLGGPLARVFNDSNHVHYAVAERLGIHPIVTDADLADIDVPLVHIKSNKNFYVYELSHSYPYLIPEAAECLNEVGRRFNDSLRARGGGDYRLKVTSMLRTDASVRQLRRVNAVAVDSSVHRFATTFDISYSRFMLNRMGGIYRTQEDLKNLLAEVLYAMRAENRCYVKYERSTGCFHITVRKPEDDV